MLDNASCLYEHIKNRLPDNYDFGDINQSFDGNGIPDHRVSQQSLREDHEGDVGIFEVYRASIPAYAGQYPCFECDMQIGVVTKNGDINEASRYLIDTFKNLKKNRESEHYYLESINLINVKPLGKNSAGLQTVVMNMHIFFITDNK